MINTRVHITTVIRVSCLASVWARTVEEVLCGVSALVFVTRGATACVKLLTPGAIIAQETHAVERVLTSHCTVSVHTYWRRTSWKIIFSFFLKKFKNLLDYFAPKPCIHRQSPPSLLIISWLWHQYFHLAANVDSLFSTKRKRIKNISRQVILQSKELNEELKTPLSVQQTITNQKD